MENEEQLEILKQGVEVWNNWRANNFDAKVNLRGSELSGLDLRSIDLNRADFSHVLHDDMTALSYAEFIGADLRKASPILADLSGADLSNSDLREADLSGANLYNANFTNANLGKAQLLECELFSTNFTGAKLADAVLSGAKLMHSNLDGADFSNALMGGTTLGFVDLSQASGLDKVKHYQPSTIGIQTIAESKGNIPEIFLRGCGLTDWEIESAKLYNPNLGNEDIDKILYKIHDLRATQAIQISPLFISYSHEDAPFVDKLETYLNNKGIRFWRDIHDMKSGRMEKQIDRAIRQNPTVLLILSENSIKSDWVEHEVRTARDLEKEAGHDVLCPVALDDSWKSSPWPKRLMEQVMEYNILPFSSWKDDSIFEQTFVKLIDGLQLFYKG